MVHFSLVGLLIPLIITKSFAGPVHTNYARHSPSPRAIYFQSNQASNSIIALPISPNGTLSHGAMTSTGGAGGNSIDAMTMAPAGPDALASQGAVTVVGNLLFAVNAGSDSLSMFRIDEENPTSLTLVGQPMATGGKFPVSVAVSQRMKMACVGHSGSVAGVSCAGFSTNGGLRAFDSIRPFDLGQSDPPHGPLNTLSHTFFAEDGSTLISTMKGDPTANKTGFVSIFPACSQQETRISPKGTAVLFGAKQIQGTSKLLVTDASFGYVISDLNDLATPLSQTAVEGQMATCWTTISPSTKTGFVTDVGKNTLVEADLNNGSIISKAVPSNGNPGMIDLVAAGNKVYALSPGNGTASASVAVFDVSAGPGKAKAIQNFAVDGADKNSQGMAFF